MNAPCRMQSNFHNEILGSDSGIIVTAVSGEGLGDVTPDQIKEWVASSGALLLRNFKGSRDEFSEMVRRASKRVAVDPARLFVSKSVQLVDAGTDEIGLHCENGNAPKLPDVIWFHCEKAALKGSRTTICDGRRVWEALPTSARTAFSEQRIMYRRTLPGELWKRYIFHEVGGFSNFEAVTFQDLQNFASTIDGQTFRLLDNDVVASEFRCYAVHTTRFSDQLAFANSLLGPSYNYEKPLITFEDGTEISQELLEIVSSCTEICTDEISWQDGDVAVIDNSRFMHGRRKIEDSQRRLHAALSYI